MAMIEGGRYPLQIEYYSMLWDIEYTLDADGRCNGIYLPEELCQVCDEWDAIAIDGIVDQLLNAAS